MNDGDLAAAVGCLDANAGTSAQLHIDVMDHDGNTPLSEAACYGEVELARLFLSRGAHPDSRNELGRTPLWRACYNGHADIVQLLLQHGADKSIPNNLGEEPIKCLRSSSECVSFRFCADKRALHVGLHHFFAHCSRYGTAATRSFIESWDPLETERLKESLNLKHWQKASATSALAPLVVERKQSPCLWMNPDYDVEITGSKRLCCMHSLAALNVALRLEEMISNGNLTWPVKVALGELQLALIAAHDAGKARPAPTPHLK